MPHLAVDGGGDVQRRGEGDLVGGDDAGAHGGKAVQALAEVPLLVAGLQVPGGDVVDDGVAEDVLGGLFRRHVPGVLAQDHRQFHLIVQLFHQARVTGDVSAGGHSLIHPLGKVHGCGLFLGEGAGVIAGGLRLVGLVVHTQAQNVLPGTGNGRKKRDLGRGNHGAGLLCLDRHGPQVGQGRSGDQLIHVLEGERRHMGTVSGQGAHVFGAAEAIGDEFHG